MLLHLNYVNKFATPEHLRISKLIKNGSTHCMNSLKTLKKETGFQCAFP